MLMYIGHALLALFIILTLLGFMDGVLKRWNVSKTATIIVSLLILGGLFIPVIRIADMFIISIGGFVFPLAVCIYLLSRAGTAWEFWRTIISAVIIGVVAANLIYFFPVQSQIAYVDYSLFLGIIGGAIAFIIGRSRRSAFISAALGIMFVSFFEYNIYWTQGFEYVLVFGSASIFSATILSAVIALLFAEIAGETLELSKTGKTDVQQFDIDDYVNQH